MLQAALCPADPPKTAPSPPLLYIADKRHNHLHGTSSTRKTVLGFFNLQHLKYRSLTLDLTSYIFKWYHMLLCVTYFGQLQQCSDWSINESPASDCISLQSQACEDQKCISLLEAESRWGDWDSWEGLTFNAVLWGFAEAGHELKQKERGTMDKNKDWVIKECMRFYG